MAKEFFEEQDDTFTGMSGFLIKSHDPVRVLVFESEEQMKNFKRRSVHNLRSVENASLILVKEGEGFRTLKNRWSIKDFLSL